MCGCDAGRAYLKRDTSSTLFLFLLSLICTFNKLWMLLASKAGCSHPFFPALSSPQKLRAGWLWGSCLWPVLHQFWVTAEGSEPDHGRSSPPAGSHRVQSCWAVALEARSSLLWGGLCLGPSCSGEAVLEIHPVSPGRVGICFDGARFLGLGFLAIYVLCSLLLCT